MPRTQTLLSVDVSMTRQPQSLHGYLDNLGPLSSLPTPTVERLLPLQSIHTADIAESVYDDRKALRGKSKNRCSRFHTLDLHNPGIAKKLAQICARSSQGQKLLAADVMEYLEAAHLPVESLALTYNILDEITRPRSRFTRNDSCAVGESVLEEEAISCRSELLLIAALQLAASFLDNHVLSWTQWDGETLSRDIDKAELWRTSADLLERVGHRLSALTTKEAKESALQILDVGSGGSSVTSRLDGNFARQKSARRLGGGYFDGC